jgi:hypothetical protein
MFHNTIKLNGKDLLEAVKAADTQELKIKYLFVTRQILIATPFEVAAKLSELGFDYPITSVRRAMTNLTPKILEKTLYQKKGEYGKPNYCWRLNPNYGKKIIKTGF